MAAELALLDRFRTPPTLREQALWLWREVGDRVREGDTLRRLSRHLWRLCRGAEAAAPADGAIARDWSPLGPWASWPGRTRTSRTTGWTGASTSRGDPARLARRAALAEPLGLFEVLSDALNTEACASAGLGGDWAPLLHRSLEIAK